MSEQTDHEAERMYCTEMKEAMSGWRHSNVRKVIRGIAHIREGIGIKFHNENKWSTQKQVKGHEYNTKNWKQRCNFVCMALYNLLYMYM